MPKQPHRTRVCYAVGRGRRSVRRRIFLFWLFALLTALNGLMVAPCGKAATLIGSFAPLLPGTEVDLTAEGTSDWAHWGLDLTNLFDHKIGVTQQISNFTLLGVETAQQEIANLIGYTWSDGIPDLTVTQTTTALSVTGLLNGFHLS